MRREWRRDRPRMQRVGVQPAGGSVRDGLGERNEGDVARRHRRYRIAVDAVRDPDAGAGERDDEKRSGDTRGDDRPPLHRAFGAQLQIDRPVHRQHRGAHDPGEQTEGIEEIEKRSGVVDAQIGIEVERDAQKQVAESDAEDQRRHGAADEEAPVPRAAPARIGNLAAVVEADRTQKQREQRQDQRHVEAGERRRVDERPRRERRAARGNEPDLVALPVRTDRVEHDATLVIVAPDEGQQRADAEVACRP